MLAILGAGNIGTAIARGLVRADGYAPSDFILTRRHPEALESMAADGFGVQTDNGDAVRRSDTVILAVQPQQLDDLLEEIKHELDARRQLLVSVVSGAQITQCIFAYFFDDIAATNHRTLKLYVIVPHGMGCPLFGQFFAVG